MHITGMRKHSSIWPYVKEAEGVEWNVFEFDRQVNLFVGPNAAGKTSLLNLISGKLFVEGFQASSALNLHYSENVSEWLGTLHIQEMVRHLPAVHIEVDRPNGSKVTNLQDSLLGKLEEIRNVPSNSFTEDDRRVAGEKPVSGYDGRNAFYVLNNKMAIRDALDERDTVGSMASGAEIKPNMDATEPYTLLGKEMIEIDDEDIFMYMTQSSSRVDANFQKAVLLSYHCAKDICAEVIAAEFPGDQAVLTESRGGMPSARVELGVKIKTSDSNLRGETADPFHVSRLSSGTAGTLWWVRHLTFEMLRYYEFHFGWEKKPMILLIDEIENHLHPTWQRRVIPTLLKYFPGLQIFATTHSPFVVAGLKAGQVHMLKRDGNGVVTASTNEQDIIGWTTDEILRTFMGVDEPTDQLTIDRARRLRELRGKDSLTYDEATEMEELRRQVNEDFLSSSTPLEAQRERYGDMMLKFLRSRESELSQDGD